MKKRYIIYVQEKDKDGNVIREDYLFATDIRESKIRKLLKWENVVRKLFYDSIIAYVLLENASDEMKQKFYKGESVATLGIYGSLIRNFLNEDGNVWNEPDLSRVE